MGKEKGTRGRVFIKLFTTSQLGLNIINTVIKKRDSGDQSKLRADLLEIPKTRHPDEARDLVWCPVTRIYHDELFMTAGHLFSFRQGQDNTDTIFERNAKLELFSPYNGILMSNVAESLLDKGYYVIVPQVSGNPSAQDIQDWHKVEPKNYKIRVLQPDMKAMNHFIDKSERRWCDLDGQMVREISPKGTILLLYLLRSRTEKLLGAKISQPRRLMTNWASRIRALLADS